MRTLAKLLFSILVVTLVVSPTRAHEGMIALYADQTASSCQVDLPEFQLINLSLFYIRGDGPRFGKVCEFRLLKSTDGIQFGSPIWGPEHGTVLTIGNLETGIAIGYHAGEGWCPPDEDTFFMGTIPVMNISDPDTFTVSVVKTLECAPTCGIFTVSCVDGLIIYELIGGTFVFNGTCNSPEDPFGTSLGVESSSWGAIKKIYSE